MNNKFHPSNIFLKINSFILKKLNWSVSKVLFKNSKSCSNFPNIEYPCLLFGIHNVSIGASFISKRNLKLRTFDSFENQTFNPTILIGNNFYSGTDNHIGIIGKLIIGDNVTLASRVTIIDHNHGELDYSDKETPVLKRKITSKGPIHIEDNVWLCENVVVLGGVTIGENSIIAANSVVTKDIPPNCLAAGAPAIVIKTM